MEATLFEMKIKAVAPWAGSKRTLAETICVELGEHRAFWDVFCGSMAVLLEKKPSTFETVNDRHGDLINLARVLVGEETAVDLYGRLSRFLMHEGFFHEAAMRWKARGHAPAPDAPDVDRALDFFVCSWMGRNGVAGTESYNLGFCVRYTKNGGHAATRFLSCVESIPAWHQRLRSVTILNRDGFALLERIEDAPGVCIYCDPPYIKKGFRYVHDFENWDNVIEDDHDRLASLLRRFRQTRVVVSYYEHPRLVELYPGWTKRAVYTTKAMASQGQRGEKGKAEVAPEVLLLNGPSYEKGGIL